MSTHPRVEILSTYLDNCLSQQESRQVEAHLERCETCRLRLRSMQGVVRKLAALERRSPPPALGVQLRKLSAVQATRPSLIDRIEEGATRLGTDNALLPMFGVVVALIVIIYLLSWGYSRVPSPDLPPEPVPAERSSDRGPVSVGTESVTESRQAAGRTFDLIGDTWIERGIDEQLDADRYSLDATQVQSWFAEYPDLQGLFGPASGIRLRIDQRVVEIRLADAD